MSVDRLWLIKTYCYPRRTVEAAAGGPFPPAVGAWWVRGLLPR